MSKSTTLVSCPKCGTSNFTPRGLKSHRCDGTNRNPKNLPAAPGGAPSRKSEPTSLTVVAPGKFDDATLGVQLTEQYEKATGGMKAIFVFGAMMLQIREVVSTCGNNSSRGPQTKGDGLKGWLTEFAPTVHLSTAYRFMTLAEGLREEFRLGSKCDMVRLLTAPADDLKKGEATTRKKIEAFVEGKSQRQLMFEFGYAEAKEKGGKKNKNSDKPLTPEEEEEAARLEAITFYNILHRDLSSMKNNELKKLPYVPVLSEDLVVEIDLHHLETALAACLQAVRDELTTRGETPTTRIK